MFVCLLFVCFFVFLFCFFAGSSGEGASNYGGTAGGIDDSVLQAYQKGTQMHVIKVMEQLTADMGERIATLHLLAKANNPKANAPPRIFTDSAAVIDRARGMLQCAFSLQVFYCVSFCLSKLLTVLLGGVVRVPECRKLGGDGKTDLLPQEFFARQGYHQRGARNLRLGQWSRRCMWFCRRRHPGS